MHPTGNPFEIIGQACACVGADVPLARVKCAAAMLDTMRTDSNGTFHRMAAKCASAIYEAAGKQTEFGFSLFSKIAEANWSPAFEPFMDAFYEAMGTMEKKAAPWVRDIALAGSNVAGAVAKVAPDAALATIGSSMLLGSGLGALHWKMNRDVDQDDPESEVMKARAGEYARLANEIEHNLKLKQHARGVTNAQPSRPGFTATR